ncbi:unnamed protein product [Chondrus crispus]|uniref:CAAX prenyl protease 2/Lysostaphin resistance protein A-like domain-containing protein n=1 Tax=Chondrus crispus TaxID=2769 RepID=R7Q577_CHOCR|nr:unnamed protein product [Chondrus crispus]CDF32615.1 unnamed protein product [Chondrus crispus]|eukprot:XP_005712386.1 unnamed protein product [Chondrus crispus]
MNGVTEELIFRGMIQNMLEQRLGHGSISAPLIASVAFGIAHLGKSKLGYDPPNVRYMASACVTGVACGFVWRQTGKVTASALTQATSNYIMWRVTLSKKVGQ